MLGVRVGRNSGMYDRAVLAMQQAGEGPDASTTMQSVLAVKEYLSNKMTKRKSPSGKERWKNCMQFLHDAMPAEEFKEYCDQINRVRKAKEGSPDQVKPEQFDLKPQKNAAPEEPEKNNVNAGLESGSPVSI